MGLDNSSCLKRGDYRLWFLLLSRKTTSSSEWFLGGRSLPWWGLGLSILATAVDNADLVSVTGLVYNNGIHILTVFTLATVLGCCLSAFLVVPWMYRLGCYTNAEFLEYRFGKTLRLFSALIQIQYRTAILGLMVWSFYLMLTGMVGLESWLAWTLIVLLVLFTPVTPCWGDWLRWSGRMPCRVSSSSQAVRPSSSLSGVRSVAGPDWRTS
ncbi:MAG: hypothetical protein R3C11_16975 [Planctomycetaceae bacterium]